jgi:hypothetical protein
MGIWQKELDRLLAQSEKNKIFTEKQQKHYQKVADACQAFVSGWMKANAQFSKNLTSLMDIAEEAAKSAAELLVLEDELMVAQDFGDKAEIKNVEGKMKPHIKAFEASKKEGLKTAEEGNKIDDEMIKLSEAVTAAAG